jgi:hypothetical protein
MLALLLCGMAATARADGNAQPSDPTTEARLLYQRATELVNRAQWYEALSLFERSMTLRPHAVTAFNIAACERAVGRYTRALVQYRKLAAASGADAPPPALAAEIATRSSEVEAILVHATVRIDPAEAALGVDGRPLERVEGGALWAGIREPGAGQPTGGAFELIADPGAHLLTLTRPGYQPQVLRAQWSPGERPTLRLELTRLPARLHIASDRERAVVSLDGVDVGLAPLDLERPPGSYSVLVQKHGYHSYRTSVTLTAGQEASLRASLEFTRPQVWKKWWFWTSAGVVVAGVALGAYFGARASEPPQLDGGGLQWVAKVH